MVLVQTQQKGKTFVVFDDDNMVGRVGGIENVQRRIIIAMLGSHAHKVFSRRMDEMKCFI